MSRCFAGHFLVASPYLSDRNFFRSVVLIVSHDHDHAFGLLLNRQGYGTLADAWTELTGDPCERRERLRSGGPLDGPMVILHQDSNCCDSKVVSDVYLSTSEELVAKLVRSDQTPLVPIVGYSGWGPGQLENELDVGGWMTLEATEEVVFCSPDEMWSRASEHVSDSIMPHFSSRRIPSDPRMN